VNVGPVRTIECGGSDILKNIIENIISCNIVPCIKFKRIQWTGQVQILLLDHEPKEVLKAELLVIDQWVD